MSELDQSQELPKKKKSCLDRLHAILDGEATAEEKKEFVERHLDQCLPCYKKYHLEMAIRDLLKTRCCNQQAPADIIENIKSMINSAR